ncbi:MAG: TonB-dependent receptor [Burkholderiales bacterium]|nr:TonB-dependent receptor [Burkholderiales bacterium]
MSRWSTSVALAGVLSAGSFPVAAQIALNPVVVTATRMDTTIDRALADVTVIESQQIRDAGMSTLPELLRAYGGIEISQTGGAGTVSGLFMRGTKPSQTLVLVDGIRLESPLSGGALPEFLPLAAIERIEIVRGPMSALYGSGAVGGVIQIFTRQAREPGWRGSFSAGVGSRGTRQVQGGISGANENTRFALHASSERTSGFDATLPGSFDFQPDRDGHRNHSLTASLSHKLSTRWEIGGNLLVSDGKVFYDSAFSAPADTWQSYRSSALSLFARGRVLDGWQTELRLGQSAIDYTAGSYAFAPRTDSRTLSWQNTVEAGGGRFLFGAETLEQKIDGEGVTRGDFVYARDDRSTHSLFGGYERQFGDHLLRGTLRRDHIESVGGKTTGALAWGWQFTPQWLLRASYGTAFRAPTFDDLYNAFGPNPLLKPEHSRGGEIALEHRQGANLARATIFASRIEQAIELDSMFIARNLAQAKVRGLTLEARRALGAFNVRASATFQHTEGSMDDGSDAGRGTDELVRRAPRYGVLGVDWREGRWRLGADAVAQARRFDTQGQRLGGYLFVDAWASYELSRQWELFARAGNLTDKQYQTVFGYRAPPRSLFVGVRYAMR